MPSLLRQNKITLALALPIMVGHVGQMLLGLADTVMIGRVGTTELAAAAFANVIFNTFFVGLQCSGILLTGEVVAGLL